MRTVLIPAKLYAYRRAGQIDPARALKLAAYVLVFGAGFAIGTSLLRPGIPAPPRAVTQTAPLLEKVQTNPFTPVGSPVAPPGISPNNRADATAAAPPAVPRKQRGEAASVLQSAPAAREDRTTGPLDYRVQAGAFMVREYAQELVDQLRSHHYVAAIFVVATSPPYRVWMTGALDRAGAELLVGRLQRDGFEAVAVKIEARSCERVETNCAALGTVPQSGTPVGNPSGVMGGRLNGKRSDAAILTAAPVRPAIPEQHSRPAQSAPMAPPIQLLPSAAAAAQPRPPAQPEPIAAIQVAPGIPASILPGEGVGAVKLGATFADLAGLFGNATDTMRLADGSVTHWWFDASKQEGFGVRVADNGLVDRLYLKNDARYITEAGLGVGSTEPEVRMALGAPTVDIVTNTQKEILRYDPLGVWFEIQLDPKSEKYATVVQIDVLAVAAPAARRMTPPPRAPEGGTSYAEGK